MQAGPAGGNPAPKSFASAKAEPRGCWRAQEVYVEGRGSIAAPQQIRGRMRVVE